MSNHAAACICTIVVNEFFLKLLENGICLLFIEFLQTNVVIRILCESVYDSARSSHIADVLNEVRSAFVQIGIKTYHLVRGFTNLDKCP